MICNQCEAQVGNSFTHKLEHLVMFHPDYLANRFSWVPGAMFNLGQKCGDFVIGCFRGESREDKLYYEQQQMKARHATNKG